ncbi:unnamed protein product, partial [Ectocarpus sp. 12 AP-2014]
GACTDQSASLVWQSHKRRWSFVRSCSKWEREQTILSVSWCCVFRGRGVSRGFHEQEIGRLHGEIKAGFRNSEMHNVTTYQTMGMVSRWGVGQPEPPQSFLAEGGATFLVNFVIEQQPGKPC